MVPVTDLVRFVSVEGTVMLDAASVLPGRGAYLHRGENGAPVPECVRQALRRRAFPRALREPGVDVSPVQAWLDAPDTPFAS